MPADGGTLLLRTLRLGAEPPAGLGASWGAVAAGPMCELVQLERCGTWLHRRLRDLGLESVVTPALGEWLAKRSRAGLAQTLLIDARAVELGRWLTGRGVPFVFLKGIARRLLAREYPYIDARVTTDVDILLRAADAPGIWRALRESGYAPSMAEEELPHGHYHLLPLAERDGVSVELHTSIARGVPGEEAWHRCTEGATSLSREGVTILVPSREELLWQSVTHAEVDGSEGYDLRHFQDAAVLLAGEGVDWPRVAGRFALPEIRDAVRMRGWLAAASWLAGLEVPAPVRGGVAPFDLERALRWRYLVARRSLGRPRLLERLVDEGTRSDVGLPMRPCKPGTARLGRVKRGIATGGARSLYFLWRLMNAGPAGELA